MTNLPDWQTLEELGFQAFPATVELRDGALVCRASGGFNYRNSSVSVAAPPDRDWSGILRTTCQFCRYHGIEPVLRVPDPIPGAAKALAALGWRRFREARVMLRPIGITTSDSPPEVGRWDEWLGFQRSYRGDSAKNIEQFETIMRRLEEHALPYVVRGGGAIAAAALIVPDPTADGLMNMLVAPDARGKGVGGDFLDSILNASDNASRPVWLQVRRGNAPAERLYKSRGFALAYDYGYYRPDE